MKRTEKEEVPSYHQGRAILSECQSRSEAKVLEEESEEVQWLTFNGGSQRTHCFGVGSMVDGGGIYMSGLDRKLMRTWREIIQEEFFLY